MWRFQGWETERGEKLHNRLWYIGTELQYMYTWWACVDNVLTMCATVIPLQCGPSSQPSVQSGTPLHSLLMWIQSSVPPHWYSLGGHRDMVLWGPEEDKCIWLTESHTLYTNAFAFLRLVKCRFCTVHKLHLISKDKYLNSHNKANFLICFNCCSLSVSH